MKFGRLSVATSFCSKSPANLHYAHGKKARKISKKKRVPVITFPDRISTAIKKKKLMNERTSDVKPERQLTFKNMNIIYM